MPVIHVSQTRKTEIKFSFVSLIVYINNWTIPITNYSFCVDIIAPDFQRYLENATTFLKWNFHLFLLFELFLRPKICIAFKGFPWQCWDFLGDRGVWVCVGSRFVFWQDWIWIWNAIKRLGLVARVSWECVKSVDCLARTYNVKLGMMALWRENVNLDYTVRHNMCAQEVYLTIHVGPEKRSNSKCSKSATFNYFPTGSNFNGVCKHDRWMKAFCCSGMSACCLTSCLNGQTILSYWSEESALTVAGNSALTSSMFIGLAGNCCFVWVGTSCY